MPRMVTLLPGLPAMAVVTAIGFLLSSIALVRQRLSLASTDAVHHISRRLPALCVALLGLGALVYDLPQTFASADLSPPAAHASASAAPLNRTSPNTALNFVLLGAALFLLDTPWVKRAAPQASLAEAGAPDEPRWPFQVLALMVIVNAFLALLGQLYGVTLLFGLSTAFGMSLPTALLFLVLGLGIVAARPDRGFVAILLSNNVAGQAARRLLPVVVAVPLVLGGITLLGFHLAPSFATYLLVTASIGLLVSLFWSTILTLHREVERALTYSARLSDQAIALEHQQVEIERAALLVQQRRFVRDMLASVTEGKLCLCDGHADLPAPLTPFSDAIELTAENLRVLRRRVQSASDNLKLQGERAHDLMTAVGEAAMNAVKHGGGGRGQVHVDVARGLIQVWILDQGGGIRQEDIHRATLEKGWSGAGSFGHGFFLMLRTADRTYLLTSSTGTTVVVEQDAVAPEPAWLTASSK